MVLFGDELGNPLRVLVGDRHTDFTRQLEVPTVGCGEAQRRPQPGPSHHLTLLGARRRQSQGQIYWAEVPRVRWFGYRRAYEDAQHSFEFQSPRQGSANLNTLFFNIKFYA